MTETQTAEVYRMDAPAVEEQVSPSRGAPDAGEAQPDSSEKDIPLFATKHEPLTMTWRNLYFTVKAGEETHELLSDVSGTVKPGELLAIMGPSGAGKSTMMNVLASRAPYGKHTGSIKINGHDPDQFTKKIAYVMQEDALFSFMTPRETLEFTAGMKLSNKTPEERSQTVESILDLLGLQESADRRIETIPGEKKRVAVAVELVSSPSLIFLDEPTSHLDSYSAFTLVKHLRTLARAGSTIVCTIHQPSSEVFDLFDKVMLLARGKCVYNGPVANVLDHFATAGIICKANYNAADFAMNQLQLCSLDELQPLIDTVAKSYEGDEPSVTELVGDDTSVTTASFWTQIRLLSQREGRQNTRDRELLIVRFGMALVQALLIGLYFFNTGHVWVSSSGDRMRATRNHWSAIQFMDISAMFLTAQPMLLAFPNERPIFPREYATGTYSTTPYLIAKTFIEVPNAFLQTLLSFIVAYWMVDMQGNFFYHVVAATLLGIVTSSSTLVLGALTSRANDALNMAPLIYTPQMIASGVFLSADGMKDWIRWIQWICPLKYGIGLSSIIELNSDHVPDASQASVDFILDGADIDTEDWWWYVIVLVCFFVVLRILTAVMLARRAGTFA